MQCVICKHGETEPGKTPVMLHRGETVVVIKDVPAEICRQCGEYYVDDTTAARLLAMTEASVELHAEVEILRYVA